jgi:propionyl-CoA carboxylase beta chain
VVTGYGTIDGREVCIFSQDVAVFGGSLGEVYGEKIVKVQELAIKTGRPLIGINDGAGARIQEGVVSLGLYSRIFRNNILASGVIPQISLIMGAAAGGHVYSPALTDFVVMVDQTSQMFITGPDVIKTVTGEDVTMEELGGAHTHMAKSGTAHYVASGEHDAFDYVRELLSYLPSNNYADPPRYAAGVPEGAVEGRPVGIVANQPTQFAGCLDINASEKAARFVRTCDCFNVPIVMLVDVPGFLPGTDQEYNGIIRRGAKLLYAYGEATVAKVTVITRKAYGGAYCVMGSKDMGADVCVAWPTAQIAVMGASGAVGFVYRSELKQAAQKGEDVDALRLQLQQDYEDTLVNPYIAAERGYVDAVIPPSHTRGYVATALRLLERKVVQIPPKKHGNIPL